MRALKGVLPIAEVVGLILAVTGILWQLKLTTGSSQGLIYIYLFPVALIAALYNGRLAVLSTAIALVCADYFLQAPLYSLVNDNPREYGDLFVFAVLAVTAIKFIRVLVWPRASLAHKSPSAAEQLRQLGDLIVTPVPPTMTPRRFPPPWSVEELDACFVVRDHQPGRHKI